jgi:hypothetical protein
MKTSYMFKTGALVAAVAALTGAGVVSHANTTTTAPALKDAMIFGTSAGADTGNASGKGPAMFAGADGGSNRKRSLITFDLSSASIPSNATIVSATMTLVVAQIAGSGGQHGLPDYPDRTLSVFHLTQDWGEGNSGSPTSMSVGGSGQGYAIGTGDSSWDYTFYSTSSWTTAGGDFNSTALASVTFHEPFSLGQQLSWSTSAMATEVHNWLSTPTGYHGWEITSNLETDPTSFLGFWTKDGAAANSNSALAPVLTIVYSVP